MANIFQQYLAPPKSVLDYSAELDQADVRRQNLQQNALALAAGQQKFDEQQQAGQRAAQLRTALLGLPQGATDDQRIQAMRGTATPEGFAAADALSKSLIEQRKGTAAATKDEADAAKTSLARDVALHDFHAQKLATVQTPEDAMAWAQEGQALGLFKQPGQYERGVAMIQQAAQSPQAFAKWKAVAMQGGQSITEQLKQQLEQAKQAEQARQFGVTDQRIQSEGKANRANAIRVQQMIADRQDAGDAGNSAFTPEAISNAAARYNVDGSLPPMGMGKAGSAGRAAILNEAARQKAGVDGEQQRRDQITNKNDLAAQGAAIKSFATGKDGQAVQSANTALNHLDTIEQLAAAQKTGDVQAFNRAARALGSQLGQAAPTNLNAALIMVAPEVSKAVIGAGGTGHERDQAIQALNPNGSPDQILGATRTMRELFGGRLSESKRTYERTTGKTDFDRALSPAAQRVLSAKSEATSLPATNRKGWTLHVDASGNKAYIAPNGKDYEEVH